MVEVGRRQDVLWQEAFGHLTYEPGAPLCTSETIFDLASLTKVISTTTLVMDLVRDGLISLEMGIRDTGLEWTGDRLETITIRQLLEHSSGLPAHVRFWETCRSRADVTQELARLTIEYQADTKSLYSDPGFILLGFALEQVARTTLDEQFRAWNDRTLGQSGIAYRPSFSPSGLSLSPPPPSLSPSPRRSPESGDHDPDFEKIAPTEIDPWRGRLLRGEVHDENAALLGGVAGHAGLFGSGPDVGRFARLVLETFQRETPLSTPALIRTFATRSRVPGSSRAVGWDTMMPTSSCGRLMSPAAIGHTGFTGTSLWIDPPRDVYVVLLTNRVHPTRENNALPELRPRFHDAVMREFLTSYF